MYNEGIKSVSFFQDKILRDIITLHTGVFQVDVTYGSGCFYKRIPHPQICFDLEPRKPEVIKADVCHLPLEDESVASLIFDPPFMARTGPGAQLKERFGEIVGTIQDLWRFYWDAMLEIHRVVAPGGWFVMKCQDGVLSGKNNNTYVEVCNRAADLGFVWEDTFILLARHRMMHPKHLKQVHARKYHSYFLVFRKPGKLPKDIQPKLLIDRPVPKQGLVF